MCHFITSTLPSTANKDSLKPVFDKYRMAFQQLDNSSVLSQLKKGLSYFVATGKECDCGTPLGGASQNRPGEFRIESKELNRLKRKGWSQSKIERWVEEKKKTQAKR